MLACFIAILMCCAIPVSPLNILGIHPADSKSHHVIISAALLEMAKRGHNVTVITTITHKNTPDNYRQIKVESENSWKLWGVTNRFEYQYKFYPLSSYNLLGKTYLKTEMSLNSTEVRHFMDHDDSKFDLVVCEDFYMHAFYMFVHKYNAPLVLISSFGSAHYISDYMGSPLELASVPHQFLSYFGPMNIMQRTNNIMCTFWDFVIGKLYKRWHDQLAKKHFKNLPQPLPSVDSLERNASLVLLNTHFSMDSIRPYMPNVIEIGGIHLKEPQELPYDLQEIMDRASEGVIYFALGMNLIATQLSDDKRDAFLKVFSSLNQTILWKWEDDHIRNKSDNIIIRKWMPQNDILAHPNVKLFITHGGLLSAQEAIYHGVPVIGIPIFGDQHRNVAKAKAMGFGEGLDYYKLDVEHIESVINKVLFDSSYRKKAMELKAIFKDRPKSVMETAIYWIEYVARHNGAMHMKSTTVWMPWYEYYLLDIILMLSAGFLLIVYMFCKLKSLLLQFSYKININVYHTKQKLKKN